MTLRWMEGFEDHTTTDALTRMYTGATSVTTVTLPSGSEAQLNTSTEQLSGVGTTQILHTPDLVAAPTNTWFMGCNIKMGGGQGSGGLTTGLVAPYHGLHNSAGEQCRVEMYEEQAANAKPGSWVWGWRLMRGTTELARTNERWSSMTQTFGGWDNFQFKIVVSDTVGSIEGRWSSISRPSQNPPAGYTTLTWDVAVTGLDTQAQATTGADSYSWSFATGSQSLYADDLWVCDDAGTKNNTFLGHSCSIVTSDVALDGTTADWSLAGGAASVEDAWSENINLWNKDKRMSSNATSEIHLCTWDALAPQDADANVIGVKLSVAANMDTSGSVDLGFMWRKTTGTPAQVEAGTAMVLASTATTMEARILEDDPNTTAAWVMADIDTYQCGVKNNG